MKIYNLLLSATIGFLSAICFYGCGEDNSNDEPINILPPEENTDDPADPDDSSADSIEPLSESLLPFYKEGRRWVTETYFSSYYNPETRRTEKITIGKTEIDGCEAWEVRNSYDDYVWTTYHRDDNGKLYKRNPQEYIDKKNVTWGLQFDINATKADSIKDSYYLYPVCRGTVVTMGKTRRALKVHIPFDLAMHFDTPPYYTTRRSRYEYDYIIEGIGFVYGHELNRSLVLPTGPFGPEYIRLLECWDGEEKIFDHNDFSEEKFIEGDWE